MIKYEAYYYYKPFINKVEIEKETKRYVFFKGHRAAKHSEHRQYFSSFEEAKSFLYELYLHKLIKAEEALDGARRCLDFVKELKE